MPHQQLVRLLERARTRGLTFEEAWSEAVRPCRAVVMTNTRNPPDGCVLWPTDSRDRNGWRAAILDAKDGFRRAYERRPMTVRERAVTSLVGLLLEAHDRGAGRGMRGRGEIRSAA